MDGMIADGSYKKKKKKKKKERKKINQLLKRLTIDKKFVKCLC